MSEESRDRVHRLFQEFWRLETSLMTYLATLLKTDQFRARVVWESAGSFNQRVNLIRNLVRCFATDDDEAYVLTALNKVDKVSKIRNDFAHSSFNHLPLRKGYSRFGTVKFHKAKGREFLESEFVTYEEIDLEIEEMRNLSMQFGARGNPGHDHLVNIESKWHREFPTDQEPS